MRRTACLTVCVLLGACTPMQWVKPDTAMDQIGRDDKECRNLAWREANTRPYYYNAMTPVFTRDAMGRGMFIWNNGAVVDPFAYQMLEENRLHQFCMEAKGYSLVPMKEARQ
jgi:hypothetical protein